MRTKQSGGSTTAVFLPAELVLGVAQQLVTSGQMDHGWLGIETSDAGAADPTTVHSATTQTVVTTPRDGARLDVIDQNGPAATAGLLAGDVIVDVAGNPVHSAAELETRLYADPPGTQVDLGFVRGGTTMATSVILGDRASAVPGGDSSP
jgi:S1-C subfamily serine protease